MVVTPKQVIATLATFAISRAVVDELKPSSGDVETAYDGVVFEKTMQALRKKEANNG